MKPEYGKYPLNALEVVELEKDHGFKKAGEKVEVHPNTAILLRFKGVAVDTTKKVEKVEKKPRKKSK